MTDELKPDAELVESVVSIARTAKVVKGGRRFSFGAVVVVGDRNGRVGLGTGKANEVASAVRKGTEAAKKATFHVNLKGRTIPHEVMAKCDGSVVLLKPASSGTGIIAGSSVRVVLEAAGVKDVLSKSLGASNRLNMAKATIGALKSLKSWEEVKEQRGIGGGTDAQAGPEAAR